MQSHVQAAPAKANGPGGTFSHGIPDVEGRPTSRFTARRRHEFMVTTRWQRINESGTLQQLCFSRPTRIIRPWPTVHPEMRSYCCKPGEFRVVRRRRKLADATTITRDVVEHPGAVVIVPLLDDGRVCLVQNYRIAVDATLVELPAGTLEPGESPAATAARELAEETGYTATNWQKLGELLMSPGIMHERTYMFVRAAYRVARRRPKRVKRSSPWWFPMTNRWR